MKDLKILYGYSYFPSKIYGDLSEHNLRYIERLKKAGFDVTGISLSVNPPSLAIPFPELNRLWHNSDPSLLKLYDHIEKESHKYDVFINGSGINLHPEFVKRLPVFTVFQCADDPESSDIFSKPVAKYYDLCLVINIAEVNNYLKWGVNNVEWIPHPSGLLPEFYNTDLTYDEVLNGDREIGLFMMCDRLSPWRKDRLDKLAAAFPDASFYGQGWPRGLLSPEKELQTLRKVKICPNIHNSTGPVNIRTYSMPANGIMLICDNKKWLSHIYKIGKEAIGFDTIDECIRLCNYYLKNDKERRIIAANGWKRATTDYNQIRVFELTYNHIKNYMKKRTRKNFSYSICKEHIKKNKKILGRILNLESYTKSKLKSLIKF